MTSRPSEDDEELLPAADGPFKKRVSTIINARKLFYEEDTYDKPYKESSYASLHCYRLHAFGKNTFRIKQGSEAAHIKNIPIGMKVLQLSCSENWAAVILETQQVWTWGDNTYGQLGHGDRTTIKFPRVISSLEHTKVTNVSCGTSHGGFITDDEELYMTGCSLYGRLGLGKYSSKDALSPTLLQVQDGAKHSLMSENSVAGMVQKESIIPEKKVNRTPSGLSTIILPARKRVSNMSHLESHGENDKSMKQPTSPPRGTSPHPLGKRTSRMSVSTLGSASATSSVPPTPTIRNLHFKSISCGDRHTLILTSQNNKQWKNSVFSFGDGGSGRLGRGSDQDQWEPRLVGEYHGSKTEIAITKVEAGHQHSAVISSNGELYTFGYGATGALGHGTFHSEYAPRKVEALKTVSDVSCGGRHTVMLTDDGRVYTCGDDTQGQLGHQEDRKKGQPVPVPKLVVMEEEDDLVGQVSAGSQHSGCVTVNTGRLYTWGDNSKAQLGGRSSSSSSTIVTVQDAVMFDNNPDRTVTHFQCSGDSTYAISYLIEANTETLPESTEVTKNELRQHKNNSNNASCESSSIVFDANACTTFDARSIPSKKESFLAKMSMHQAKLDYASMLKKDQEILQQGAEEKKKEILTPIVFKYESSKDPSKAMKKREIKGLDAWLKHRTLSKGGGGDGSNATKFAAAPRFSDKTSSSNPVSSEFTETELYSPIKPATKGPTFPRSDRKQVSVLSTPGPGAYDAKGSKGNVKSCVLRPETSVTRVPLMQPNNDSVELKKIAQGEKLVYSQSPSWSMGASYDFSKMVEKRLRLAKQR